MGAATAASPPHASVSAPATAQAGNSPAQLKTSAARHAADVRIPAVAAAAAGLAGCVMVTLLARGAVGAWAFFAAHIVVVAAVAAYARHVALSGRNTTPIVIAAVAIAATGPIGAIGTVVALLMPRRRPTSPRLLRDWYNRIAMSTDIDQVTRLCDDVSSGRHIGLEAAAPASFVAVLERGSLAARQSALGLMARDIHPEYLAALKAALQSSEPVIRVQAAAVATRIRPELRALVDRAVAKLAAGGATPAAAPGLVENLEACASSGLLDASDLIRANVTITKLKALSQASPPPTLDARNRTMPVGSARDSMLLEQRRFRDLRVARRMDAITMTGGRIRRLPRKATRGAPTPVSLFARTSGAAGSTP
jgi:hypothetical protein